MAKKDVDVETMVRDALAQIPGSDINSAITRIHKSLKERAEVVKKLADESPDDNDLKMRFYEVALEYTVFLSLLKNDRGIKEQRVEKETALVPRKSGIIVETASPEARKSSSKIILGKNKERNKLPN